MARSSSKDDLASTLVAATAGNMLQLWEATPGEPLGGSRVVSHPAPVACAAWNRNNKVVAVGCADGTIRLAYSNGNVMSALPRDAGTAAGMGAITSLSWAVGSQRLAAGSSNGCTYVFNIKPQVCKTLEAPGPGPVTALAYNPEDKYLAVAAAGGVDLTLYSCPDLRPISRLAPPPGQPITCLSAAAGEPLLAAGGGGGAVMVWDAAARRLTETYAGQHQGRVAAVAWVPLKLSFLYSGGDDGLLVLHDRRRPGKHIPFGAGAPVASVSVREDHSSLAAGRADGTVELWDTRHLSRPLHVLRASPAGAPVTSVDWQHLYTNVAQKQRDAGAQRGERPRDAGASDATAAELTAAERSRAAPVAAAPAAAVNVPARLRLQSQVPVAAPAEAAAAGLAKPPPGPHAAQPEAAAVAEAPAATPAPAYVPPGLNISPLSAMAPRRTGAEFGDCAQSASHVTPAQQLPQPQPRPRPLHLSIAPPGGGAAAPAVAAAPQQAALVAALAPTAAASFSPASSADLSAAATAPRHTPVTGAPPPELNISPLSAMRPAPGLGAAPRALRESTNSPRLPPQGQQQHAAPRLKDSATASSPAAAVAPAQPAAAMDVEDYAVLQQDDTEQQQWQQQQHKEKQALAAVAENGGGTLAAEDSTAGWSIKAQQQQQRRPPASPPPHEFAFAAAQQTLSALSSGAVAGAPACALPACAPPAPGAALAAAAAADPGLRDDILALHLDMLTQFREAQAASEARVAAVLQRQEALAAEVAGLRKQLGRLLRRRDEHLWL